MRIANVQQRFLQTRNSDTVNAYCLLLQKSTFYLARLDLIVLFRQRNSMYYRAQSRTLNNNKVKATSVTLSLGLLSTLNAQYANVMIIGRDPSMDSQ